MQVSCPRCKKSVRVNDIGAGGQIRVQCSACGAKFEISVRKKAKPAKSEDAPETVSEPETAPVPESVGENISEPVAEAAPEPVIESQPEPIHQSLFEKAPEADMEAATHAAYERMDPRKQAIVEQYKDEWKKRLKDDELQREEAMHVSAGKHSSELHRHRMKNLLLLVAYLAAFAALAVFMMQK